MTEEDTSKQLTEEEVKQILLANPQLGEYLKTEEARETGKQLRYEEYQRLLTENKTLRDRFGVGWHILSHLPYPQQIISGVLVLLLVFAAIHYWPVMGYWLINTYNLGLPSVTNILLATTLYAGGLTLLLILIFTWVPVKEFMRTRGGKNPLLFLFDKNRRVQLINPMEVYHDVWKLTEESSIQVDPSAVVIGPKKVPIMCATPEYPTGFNPRDTLAGKEPGYDMTSHENYSQLQSIRQLNQYRTGWDSFRAFAPFIIILATIILGLGLTLGPSFKDYMDNSGQWRMCEIEKGELRTQLIDAGVRPLDFTTPETLTPAKSSKPGVSQPAGSVK